MKGDRHKPKSTFMRWIDTFWDGMYKTTKKGSKRVPSLSNEKRYERRWRRRKEKNELNNDKDLE